MILSRKGTAIRSLFSWNSLPPLLFWVTWLSLSTSLLPQQWSCTGDYQSIHDLFCFCEVQSRINLWFFPLQWTKCPFFFLNCQGIFTVVFPVEPCPFGRAESSAHPISVSCNPWQCFAPLCCGLILHVSGNARQETGAAGESASGRNRTIFNLPKIVNCVLRDRKVQLNEFWEEER